MMIHNKPEPQTAFTLLDVAKLLKAPRYDGMESVELRFLLTAPSEVVPEDLIYVESMPDANTIRATTRCGPPNGRLRVWHKKTTALDNIDISHFISMVKDISKLGGGMKILLSQTTHQLLTNSGLMGAFDEADTTVQERPVRSKR